MEVGHDYQSLLDLEDSLWRREGGGKAQKAQSNLVTLPEAPARILLRDLQASRNFVTFSLSLLVFVLVSL